QPQQYARRIDDNEVHGGAATSLMTWTTRTSDINNSSDGVMSANDSRQCSSDISDSISGRCEDSRGRFVDNSSAMRAALHPRVNSSSALQVQDPKRVRHARRRRGEHLHARASANNEHSDGQRRSPRVRTIEREL
ncbi:hypothetical protein Dimus_013319, partial [Dionaea muscipula]